MNAFERLIRERGFNMTTLAKRAGIPRQNVYNCTNGRGDIRKMGVLHVRKIARALGMTLDEFMDYIEENMNDAED